MKKVFKWLLYGAIGASALLVLIFLAFVFFVRGLPH